MFPSIPVDYQPSSHALPVNLCRHICKETHLGTTLRQYRPAESAAKESRGMLGEHTRASSTSDALRVQHQQYFSLATHVT
jgi:hypothetical protein